MRKAILCHNGEFARLVQPDHPRNIVPVDEIRRGPLSEYQFFYWDTDWTGEPRRRYLNMDSSGELGFVHSFNYRKMFPISAPLDFLCWIAARSINNWSCYPILPRATISTPEGGEIILGTLERNTPIATSILAKLIKGLFMARLRDGATNPVEGYIIPYWDNDHQDANVAIAANPFVIASPPYRSTMLVTDSEDSVAVARILDLPIYRYTRDTISIY